MVELWVVLTLTASFLWTIVALIDKFVLSHELKDPVLASAIAGMSVFVLFFIVSVFLDNIVILPISFILIALLAGIFYTLAIYFYYYAIKKGEISRVVSFISISPIFMIILAFLFLNERLTFLNYLGIILIVLGSFLISIKKDHAKYIFSASLLAAIVAALFLSFRDLLVQFIFIGLETNIWPILFWIGLGSGLAALFLFAKHKHGLHKKCSRWSETSYNW